MIILALFLLIIGISKLCIITVSNEMEVKELFYNTPVLVDVPPGAMKALLTADGLICTFGGIALLCL